MTIPASGTLPGWAFTIGLGHTFGHPEISMFGLRPGDMASWLNQLGERVGSGHTLVDEQLVDDVLPSAPLIIRSIHRSWFPELFGTAMWFTQHPPLRVLQAVWPDRHGLFPWDETAGVRCRLDQPQAWLSVHEHPRSSWKNQSDVWPFSDSPDTRAYTTVRIMRDGQPITLVAHDTEGSWQFLDGQPVGVDDVELIHLRHAIDLDPTTAEVADLPIGWEAERTSKSKPWTRNVIADG